MLELVRRLDPSRWDVHVACFRTEGSWFSRVPRTAAVARFPVTSFRRPAFVREMARFAAWCRARQIAIVHASDLPMNFFALTAAAAARVPVRIGNRREIVANRTTTEVALQRIGYACAHKIVANSRAAAARLITERVPSRKIVVIPNGLDLLTSEASDPPGTRRDRTPAAKKIIMVANLRKEKRHDVLIDAAPLVLERFPETSIELVGDGPERVRLIERARMRGVDRAVVFAGHCEDVAARLAGADVFVLCSESEAFPNALLEAMSAGLPAVASDTGGISEVLVDGRTGLLAPVGDAAALADRLCRLLSDTALAARFGATARETVRSRYSFERMASAFERLYLDELSRRGLVDTTRPELAPS